MRTRRRLEAALRAYVEGHDRGWDADRKRRAVAAADSPEPESEPEIAWSPEPESPSFGVGVPDELDFHRGPDTWRESGNVGA